MSKEQQFDEHCKNLIERLDIQQPADAWERFTQSTGWQSMGAERSFDDQMRKTLGSMSAIPQTGEWEKFNQHWEAQKALDQRRFDAAVRNKVINTMPSMKAPEILERAIRHSDIRNKKLIPSKIIEACLLAIICILLLMYTPLLDNKSDHNPNDERSQPATEYNQDRASADIPPVSEPAAGAQSISDDANHNIAVSLQQHQHPKAAVPSNTYGRPAVVDNTSTRILINTGASARNGKGIPSYSNDPVFGHSDFGAKEEKAITNYISNEYKSSIKVLPDIPNLLIQPASIFKSEDYPVYKTIPLTYHQPKKLLSSVWLGFRVGQAFDRIKTPSYVSGVKTVASQQFKSTIADFNIEINNDFINIESGIKYSFKKFTTGQNTVDEAHFVNIPLTVKKDFILSDKLIPYFKIGPDVTIVAAATYEPSVPEHNYLRYENLAPLKAPNSKVEDGIIYKGELSKNSFLGIHGAIGFEYKVNPLSKFTFDITQQLNPFEKGVGINNHRFSETSVTVGYKRLLFENLY